MTSADTDVVVVTTEYPVPEKPHGGIFIRRQVNHLRREGLSCHVVRLRPDRPRFPRWLRSPEWRAWTRARRGRSLDLDGEPVHEAVWDPRRVRDREMVPVMAEALGEVFPRLAPRGRPVVYAQWLWPSGAASLLAARETGWPVAAIARGSELQDWQDYRPHCRRWSVRVLEEAAAPMANCRYLRDLCEEHLPGSAERTQVIYNGCDTAEFRPAADRGAVRERLGIGPATRILLCCGAVEERKGLGELLDAWGRIAARHPSWELVLLGATPDARLLAAAQCHRAGRVRLPGPVLPTEVCSWMQAADAFVHASRVEGMPNVVLEAMATGLAVVASDCCGQREAVEHGVTGLRFAPRDASDLAAALDRVMGDDALRRHLGEAATAAVKESFDPQVQARRLATLLRDLAAKGRR